MPFKVSVATDGHDVLLHGEEGTDVLSCDEARVLAADLLRAVQLLDEAKRVVVR